MKDIYEFSKGKGLPLDSFYQGTQSKAIAYGHLYTQYSEVISKVNLSSHNEGVMSKVGDILFPASSTVPLGTAQSNALMLENVKLGGDIIIARAKGTKPYAPFLSYQINSKKEKLYPITSGTTITHMYGKDIAEISYSFTSSEEQLRIGNFLINLDQFITLHQRLRNN